MHDKELKCTKYKSAYIHRTVIIVVNMEHSIDYKKIRFAQAQPYI